MNYTNNNYTSNNKKTSPQWGNERGATGSKTPPCILEPLCFSAQHGLKTWVSF